MALRVSLRIDGDAKGAEQAATEAARAVDDLGKKAQESGKAIEVASDKASVTLGETGTAATGAARAVDDLGKRAQESGKTIELAYDKASGAFGETSSAAIGAARAVDNLGNQAQNSAKTIEGSYTKVPSAFGRVGESIAVVGSTLAAADEQSRKFNATSFQTKQTLMQLPDIIQGIAGGQGVFRTALQQGGQLVQIYGMGPGGVAGSLKQVGSELAAMITPTRLLAAGTIAVGAAAAGAYMYWKSTTLQLDDAARAAGMTTAEMSKLQAAASFNGISAADSNQGIESFAKSVYDARKNMGGLAEVFAANNVQAKTFDDYLGKAADLIKNASSDQQRLVLLQQMGLPATMDWVRFLSGGADSLNKAKKEAAEFAANEGMIRRAREFDEAWNKAWTNFGTNARLGLQGSFSLLDQLGDKAVRLAMSIPVLGQNVPTNILRNAYGANMGGTRLTSNSAVSQFYEPLGSGAPQNEQSGNPTVDPAALQRQIALQLQYVGVLGQTATVEQQVLAVRKQIEQYSLTPGAIQLTEKQKDTLVELARQQALGTSLIRAQAEAYRIEAATVGQSVSQATAYAAAQNLINRAKLQGKTLTAENVAEIEREAAAMGAAAQKSAELRLQSDLRFERGQLGRSGADATVADRLRGVYGDNVDTQMDGAIAKTMRFNATMQELKSTTLDVAQGAFRDFRTELANGVPTWQAFGTAGVNALQRIIDKAGDKALENIVSKLFGSALGGFSLGGSSSGGTGFSLTGTGGLFSEGGWTGPGGRDEPAGIVHRGEYVFDATSTSKAGVAYLDSLRAKLRGYASGGPVGIDGGLPIGGSSGPLQIRGGDMNVVINGNTDDKMLTEIKQAKQQSDAELAARVVAIVKEARERGTL